MPKLDLGRSAICAAAAVALVFTASALALAADRTGFSKDVGPANAVCDVYSKSSAAWTSCVGAADAGLPSAELFYAGYWLAKSGRYQEALAYLTRADRKSPRVLTYIGFATRKLGDVDGAMPFYGQALDIDPQYSVARAYLGEAFLTKDEPQKARAQLAEIRQRCGTSCAEYADLAGHIAAYEAAHAKG